MVEGPLGGERGVTPTAAERAVLVGRSDAREVAFVPGGREGPESRCTRGRWERAAILAVHRRIVVVPVGGSGW